MCVQGRPGVGAIHQMMIGSACGEEQKLKFRATQGKVPATIVTKSVCTQLCVWVGYLNFKWALSACCVEEILGWLVEVYTGSHSSRPLNV